MIVRNTYEVSHQPIDHDGRDALADYDTQNLDLLQIGCEFIVGHDPTLRPQKCLHPALLYRRDCLTIRFGEAEGHYGQPWLVILYSLINLRAMVKS